jgi:hypothetical protein
MKDGSPSELNPRNFVNIETLSFEITFRCNINKPTRRLKWRARMNPRSLSANQGRSRAPPYHSHRRRRGRRPAERVAITRACLSSVTSSLPAPGRPLRSPGRTYTYDMLADSVGRTCCHCCHLLLPPFLMVIGDLASHRRPPELALA